MDVADEQLDGGSVSNKDHHHRRTTGIWVIEARKQNFEWRSAFWIEVDLAIIVAIKQSEGIIG